MPSSASFDKDPLAVVVSFEKAAKVTQADLQIIGDQQINTILDRTARGVDVDGLPFAPYAKSTARKRAKSGRTTSPVNLRWTSKMLSSLRVVANAALSEVAIVLFGEEGVRGRAHNQGVGNRLPQRRWLGATEADAGRLGKILDRLISIRTQRTK